ncbi:ABC transporter permease [Mesorhizobium sp.]|uniref:ABC transporter permease n=1 Tax=Mesorhizobium sp. TaxID=1871066 RepID=UPI000FE91656|nr:ABC transporter permease [Mesorhizobium sp.]RWC33561.1 MAG: ABC transporter permease [Mesorhizobium sp.]TIX27796.1 MAG: ABC transporter permease [Mesorhizobium sp.]
MLAIIVKRIGNAALVMLVVAFIAFMIFQFLGDPVQLMLNSQATQGDRDALRIRLGLDQPVIMQFFTFVARALHGDFGVSFRNQREVMSLIAERFPATFELVMVSTVLALLIGIPLGVFAAINPKNLAARMARMVSMIGISVPAFVIGIVLILVFSVQLGWLPAFGRGEVVQFGTWSTGLLTPSGRLALIMPSISLALFQISFIMRLVTAEMLEVLRTDYIKFARARGLPDRSVHFRHALKNCMMPVVTMTGMMIGDLIAFALVTETVFQWPGMGLLFVQAVMFIDIPVMAAYLMIVSVIFITLNTIVDFIYLAVDPRLRQAGSGGGGHVR